MEFSELFLYQIGKYNEYDPCIKLQIRLRYVQIASFWRFILFLFLFLEVTVGDLFIYKSMQW